MSGNLLLDMHNNEQNRTAQVQAFDECPSATQELKSSEDGQQFYQQTISMHRLTRVTGV